MFIPFGEYLPDQGSYNSQGSPNVLNCVPEANGYGPFPSAVVASAALDDYPQGAFSVVDSGGTARTFVGDASKLNLLSAGAWTDVSKVGGYTTDPSEQWSFTAFNQYVIATNYFDPIQYYQMGVSTDFADLTGSPPKARYCARVKDFVVLGGINDGNAYPNRVQWSAFDDPLGSWAVDDATQADYQDLPSDGGWIKAVVGGEYGVIFQERAITRMTYIGSPLVFQFDPVEAGRGTQAPGSVVKFGNNIFYLGTDGFYLFNGSSSVPIGENKVNKFFFDDVDSTYIYNVRATVFPDKSIIMVSYPGPNNNDGQCDSQLLYNYTLNRWAPASVECSVPFLMFSESQDLDDISGSIDALTYSLDSVAFRAGTLKLAGFDEDRKLVTLDGDAETAVIQTKDFRPNPAGRSTIFEYRPVVVTDELDISGSVSGLLYRRDSVVHDAVPNNYIYPKENGVIYDRMSGGVFAASIRVDIEANWQAQGIELVRVERRGRR